VLNKKCGIVMRTKYKWNNKQTNRLRWGSVIINYCYYKIHFWPFLHVRHRTQWSTDDEKRGGARNFYLEVQKFRGMVAAGPPTTTLTKSLYLHEHKCHRSGPQDPRRPWMRSNIWRRKSLFYHSSTPHKLPQNRRRR